MPDLTQDEMICLAIAAEGESMLAIGRWEKPIDRLVELGLMKRFDKFNNVATPKGKEVAANGMTAVDDDFAKLSIDIHNALSVYKDSFEQAAQKLAEAARCKQKLTGAFPNQSAYGLTQDLLRRVLEILG